MINDFEDFCLYVYVIVDDMWQQIAPLVKKRGPEPRCGDSELVTMVLVGECRGWELETDLLSYWAEHRICSPSFPHKAGSIGGGVT